MSGGAGPPCGNNPDFPTGDGDRAVVDAFKAYLARRAAGGRSGAGLELPDDDRLTGAICDCGRVKQAGENHSMCYPGMD